MAAFVYLIVFGSLAGFGAYAYALHYMSPTAMGTYAYVNPVVAVIFGRILLGEPISRRVIIAMALMIGAAVLVQFGDRLARAPGSQRVAEHDVTRMPARRGTRRGGLAPEAPTPVSEYWAGRSARLPSAAGTRRRSAR